MNTYTFKCKDMGMECPFSVTSESREESKNLAGMHAMDRHAEKMATMSEEEKTAMNAQMDSVIQEASM